jgi:hypothetical protein
MNEKMYRKLPCIKVDGETHESVLHEVVEEVRYSSKIL